MTSVDRVAAIRVFNTADTRLQEDNECATYARVVAILRRSKNRMTKCSDCSREHIYDSIKADKSITLLYVRVWMMDVLY